MINKEKLLKHGFVPVNNGSFYHILIKESLDQSYYLAVSVDGWMGIKLEGLHYIGLREDLKEWEEIKTLYTCLTGKELELKE